MLDTLEKGDRIRIDGEPYDGQEFDVTSTDEQDLLFGSLVSLGLVCGCDPHSAHWVVENEYATISPVESNVEFDVGIETIEKL